MKRKRKVYQVRFKRRGRWKVATGFVFARLDAAHDYGERNAILYSDCGEHSVLHCEVMP